jgi:hypothetical protein
MTISAPIYQIICDDCFAIETFIIPENNIKEISMLSYASHGGITLENGNHRCYKCRVKAKEIINLTSEHITNIHLKIRELSHLSL